MTEQFKSIPVDKMNKDEVRQVAEAHEELRQSLGELRGVRR